jgi:hypothetical protein
MQPEDRAYWLAFVRAFPRVLVVYLAELVLALVLDLGDLLFVIVSTATILPLFVWLTRKEHAAMRAGYKRRAAERQAREL